MWRFVDLALTNVSEEHITSSFRIEKSAIEELRRSGKQVAEGWLQLGEDHVGRGGGKPGLLSED
jgi:hypothetical protein